MSSYEPETLRLIGAIPSVDGEVCGDCNVGTDTFEEVACWETTAEALALGKTMADPYEEAWRWADRDTRRAASCLLRRAGGICPVAQNGEVR